MSTTGNMRICMEMNIIIGVRAIREQSNNEEPRG
ncbi:MAG: hypothetical protein RLZZ283_65 [Candidatus Parcubacteria bacterium]|jgi:hypothetical protein